MPAVLIRLSPDTYERLQRLADQSGESVEELAASIVETNTPEDGVDPELPGIMDKVIEEYRPLLNRLAE